MFLKKYAKLCASKRTGDVCLVSCRIVSKCQQEDVTPGTAGLGKPVVVDAACRLQLGGSLLVALLSVVTIRLKVTCIVFWVD